LKLSEAERVFSNSGRWPGESKRGTKNVKGGKGETGRLGEARRLFCWLCPSSKTALAGVKKIEAAVLPKSRKSARVTAGRNVGGRGDCMTAKLGGAEKLIGGAKGC